MKKALVLNTLESEFENSCCNVFKKVNWYKSKLSAKQYHEKKLTDKFNNISSKGFVFQDEKVFSHKLFVENVYDSTSVHGVCRFTDGPSAKYQIYFGPIVEVSPEVFGCLTGLGCKPKLGCKGLSCGYLGCRSKGDYIQYVNFLNDKKNQKDVQVLNAHFGLRKDFNSETDDYVYNSITEDHLSEFVKDHYEKILSQYISDVEKFYQEGMGFIKTIDTPSFEDLFSQAMLFGTTSNQRALMADLSSFQATVRVSRFDLWYFPLVKGLLRRIIERIPVLRSFLPKKEKTFIPTARLEEANKAIVERVYEEDFNAVEEQEVIAQLVKEALIGKIPVTLAVKRKLGFFKRIFHPVEYDFHTYMIDAIQG
jgi:hypothetical protein